MGRGEDAAGGSFAEAAPGSGSGVIGSIGPGVIGELRRGAAVCARPGLTGGNGAVFLRPGAAFSAVGKFA